MNTTALARFIHERRHRGSPVVTTGELLSAIGSEGMQEALYRHWLVPDNESGYLMVNTNSGKLSEVEEACRCPECRKPTCACESLKKPDACAAQRTEMPAHMREAWEGFGVPQSSGITGGSPVAPRPPVFSPTDPVQKRPNVGDDVMVADDGKNYTGKIGSVGQDGRYRLSFGSEKPRMDREYGPNELRPLNPAQPNA